MTVQNWTFVRVESHDHMKGKAEMNYTESGNSPLTIPPSRHFRAFIFGFVFVWFISQKIPHFRQG
jgi:hypothetical protein